MKLSDFLVSEIHRLTNVEKFFGYIGGTIAHLVDSIDKNDKVELINSITEQGAGFAAEGYARTTGRTGIVFATSGPGATNLVTPIANSYFDSIPMIFITGQVNTYEYKKYNIKQCAFQETDIVQIVKPITKYAKTITDANEIAYELKKAFDIAQSGRKGPVLLDIPMNIQRANIEVNKLKKYEKNNKSKKCEIDFDINLLSQAKRPLILLGNGVNSSDSKQELKEFFKKTNLPCIESLLGIDCAQSNYKYNLGLIGTYGNRAGNIAFYKCDTLLVLGSRIDVRQTGAKTDFLENKTIIQVDIDDNELECTKFNKIKVKADIKDFLNHLNKIENLNFDISNWQEQCLKLKNYFNNEQKEYKLPNVILSECFEQLEENSVIIADVGQNQVWTAQSAVIKAGQRMFSSGGLGCMGYALPAGIGSSIAGYKTVVVSGDGGMQMNIQELEVIKRRKLPIKILVLNNHNLGMVRVFQELYFENRFASTVKDYSCPNFEKIALAYGINSISVNANSFDINTIKPLLNNNEPQLININFEIQTQVEPRLEFGNSIENASPLLTQNIIDNIIK